MGFHRIFLKSEMMSLPKDIGMMCKALFAEAVSRLPPAFMGVNRQN